MLIPAEIRTWNGASNAITGVWTANSLRGRFARGAVWSFLGAIVSQGSNLAASIITARMLGREQFGEYGMLQSTVGMFGVFAGMGLGLTTTKYVAELRLSDPNRAGRIIALSTVVAVGTGTTAVLALVALAPWLAARTLNAPHLSLDLRISAGVLLLNALNGAQSGVLAGFEAFRTIARVNLIRGVLTLPFAVAGVLLWGIHGAIAALVSAAAAGWILNHIAIRTECKRNSVPVRWKHCWSDRAILWSFSLPAFLSAAALAPAMWAATSTLVNQPRGYTEMGLFSAANQWRTAVAFLPSLLSQPLLAMLSNLGSRDLPSFRKLLLANLVLTFALSLVISVPIVLCSPWIMKAYGPDFVAGWPVLVLLILAAVISSTAAVIGQAIASLDRMWWGSNLNVVCALSLVVAAVFLVPRYGALGLAGALLAAYSAHALTVGTFLLIQFRKTQKSFTTQPVRSL